MSAPLPPWLAQPLAEALRHQRGHAMLVHGPSGVGQFEFALALAQAWLCESPLDLQACGECASCRLLQSRTHPDFCLLIPEALRESLGWAGESETRDADSKKAKPSRELKVEAVREAIVWSHKTSSRGRAKVIVIHPAQAMNAISANALLKTLEEPPEGVRLVLSASDPELLLPTIRSRCQRWALALPPAEQSLGWLQAQGVEGADVLLAAAGGRPMDAAALAADGVDAGAWSAVPAAVARGDTRPLAGWPVPRVVDTLHKLCHDAMLVALGASPRYFPEASVPAGAHLAMLSAWAKNLTRTARHDEHPWNAPLLIESLVLEGARAWPPAANARQKRFATLNTR
ncbi:DNA polymerase III subunit delta' [Ideonella sp. BN130291]|nr:DNA polymerase III subunit delta' [Ideonella sp. BN130291]